MTRSIFLPFTLILALLCLISTGCSNSAATAQAMFDKGEYEQIIKKYPDTEIARRAHAKLADNLFTAKKYDEVIKNYGDTQAAFKARNAMATDLFAQGKYQELIDQFPGSPSVMTAKNTMADSLIAHGMIDSVIRKFPDLPKVTALKDSLSKVEFDKAKALRGSARNTALQNVMNKWPGTTSYKEAARLMQEAKTKK
jgi:hypothetical protein